MKILLAEDQAMVRGALAALLSLGGEFEVTQACDGDEALSLLKTDSYDLLLTDIEMPGLTGLELAKWCQQHSTIKVIILTTFGRAGYIKRAIESGAGGFLLKDAPSDTLIKSIKKVMSGKRVIDPELAVMAISNDNDPLNDKERRALRLAGDGKSTAEIASSLFIAEGTVRNYLSEAISKLNATNRIDAARIAKQKGWL
ncbi:response regulator transcription factor [Shewanella sp. UCD-KL12]|uniref:response regulator transcription factor n=1 Tax=Shewanella sp. UCD-KL12 TaxID=1917163 RepID=UPI000970B84A|nr:response regulator transcription factor [Shewanella sp. UCD-KL12]